MSRLFTALDHRSSRRAWKLPLAAAGVLAGLATLASSASAEEALKLNMRDKANQLTTQTAVQSTAPLVEGQAYVITVSGTGSIWPGTSWGSMATCGAAEERPITPSPGAAPTLAGWDAATLFAAPYGVRIGPVGGRSCQGLNVPLGLGANLYAGFTFALGDSYNRVPPVGGFRSVPRIDHTYSYEVVGKGRPVRFQFADGTPQDNSGIFSITVRTQAECTAVACLARAGTAFDATGSPLIPTAAASVKVSGSRICRGAVKSRVLSVRVRTPLGTRFRKAVFYVNGKKRKVLGKALLKKKAGRAISTVRLRSLPTGQIKLRIEATTTVGQRLSIRRTIARCQTGSKARTIVF